MRFRSSWTAACPRPRFDSAFYRARERVRRAGLELWCSGPGCFEVHHDGAILFEGPTSAAVLEWLLQRHADAVAAPALDAE